MRARVLLASVALTVLALPAAGRADALRVTGTVRDVYGTPVQTCVTAQRSDFQNRTIVTAPDGTYAIDLLPGTYTITAHDLITWKDPPDCNYHGAWSPKRFNDHARSVVVPALEPVDFSMRYYLSAAPENTLQGTCCPYDTNSMRPGDTMGLYATLHKAAADRGFIRWRDQLGTEIVLQPSGVNHDWIRFYAEFGIPDGRGDFTSTFEFVDAGGVAAANAWAYTTVIDDVPPVITDTFPREGDVVTEATVLTVSWSDDLGEVRSPTGKLFDVTSGQRVEVWRGSMSSTGNQSARSKFLTLQVGHHYEADLKVTDRAGNTSETSVSFTVGPREDQLTDPAPLGVVTSPTQRLEITYGAVIDPASLRFVVKRLTAPAFMLTVRPSYDPETRRAWMEYAKAEPTSPQSATGFPPLFDGTYEVTVRGTGPGSGFITRTWTFDVHLEAN